MKIQHSDKRKVGRPSFKSITARIAPHHAAVTFSTSLAMAIGINSQSRLDVIEIDNNLLMSVEADSKYQVKKGKADVRNGKSRTEYRCSCKKLVLMILGKYNRNKVVTLAIGATPIMVGKSAYYKIIAEIGGY